MHAAVAELLLFFAAHGPEQPGAGDQPQPVGGPATQAEHVRGLLVLEPGEEPELDQRRGLGVVPLQFVEGVVDGDEFVHAVVGDEQVVASNSCRDPPPPRLSRWRRGRARRGCAAWPRRRRRRSARGRCSAGRPTSRRYASWTRAVAWSVWPGFSWASLLRRQLPQFVIDQRQQLLGGLRVTLLDGVRMRVTSVIRQARRRAARALSPNPGSVRAYRYPVRDRPVQGSFLRRPASRLALALRGRVFSLEIARPGMRGTAAGVR